MFFINISVINNKKQTNRIKRKLNEVLKKAREGIKNDENTNTYSPTNFIIA